MNKADKSFLFKSSLVAALLVGSFGAHAAGLGKLTVYSAIGQPLNAEVAVTATPEELNSLTARVASHDAFKEAGIEFMPALTGLRFSVVKSANGQPMLRLTTDAPLNEPFLHFLVELNWTSGRMVREYTFLLDPPEMLKVAKPTAAVTPAMAEPAVKPAAKPVAPAPAPVRVELAPAPAPAAAVPAAKGSAASEVRVKQGDTLSKIARENLPATISLDQMLVALFNKNRDAFDGDNMNRLRAGKILRVPDAGEAAKATPTEARKVVLSQGADFNAYRRRLAEAAGGAAPSEAPAGQHVAGKIKPQVEEKAAPAPQADKLEVSRTETGKAPKVDGKGDAAVKARLEEELVARDKSLREASERIAQLEKNLENLKKLVELKSQAGAQLQQQAAAPAKPEPAPAKPVEPAPAVVPAPAPAPVTPAAPAPEPKTEPAPAPVAATPAASTEPAPAPAAVEPPKPAAKKKPVAPPPPPPPEPSFVEDNPELVFGGGGLIALLLGYLGFSAWRKKKQAKDQSADFAETPSAMAEPAPVPVVTAPAALTDDVSILGDFSESGALTSEENVDPVAEADVLMAYGRDGQAEEILLEGLKNDPERIAIHVKLMELYANRKDVARFEAVAIDVRKLSGETGPDWDKTLALAAGMGVSLAEETVAPAPEPAAVMVEEVDLPVAVEEDDSSKTVILSAPPAVEAPAPEAAAGDSLDFDLDLGTTSGPAQAAAEQAAAAQPAAEEVMSLDFDFDLGTPETSTAADVPVEAPVAAVEAEVEVPAPVDDNAIDFSFDLDAPIAAEATAPAAEEAPVVESVEMSAAASSDGMDFDIDLGEPEMAAAPAPAESVPAGGALSDLNIDFDLDLDAGSPAEEAAPPVETIEIDLPVAEPEVEAAPLEAEASSDLDMDLSLDGDNSDLALPAVSIDPVEAPQVAGGGGGVGEIELPDLDLPVPAMDISLDEVVQPTSMDVALEEPAAGLSEIEDLPDVLAEDAADASSIPDDPEVATKLELAQAYEEMGDREGARELLNEVLTEGSAAQQAAARARLDQLDA